MLDTHRDIETPEGVELQLRPAGPIARAIAWFIDGCLRIGINMLAALVLQFLGKFGMGVLLIFMFLLEWFYPVLFEIYWHGETPGKRWLGLRVLNDNGTPIGWGASLIRNLLRSVDFLPLFNGFGLICMLLNRDFKRLGDLAAGSIVVYKDSLQHTSLVPNLPAYTPPVALRLEEQRAIINFAERAQRLTDVRAAELADIVEPITGARGFAGIQRLYAMANWFLGKR
ncbi:MAG: RDD family protein [Gammaproteobacteria bacterium]|nr:RDD family protein [Gammaproteobacteria bacterium]